MADFVMPSLGPDMTEGTLLAWRKRPGERVERGEILAEVDTDKAAIEAESFASGILERILVEPGAKVPVGTVLAVIREDGAPRPSPLPPGVAPPTAPARPPAEDREERMRRAIAAAMGRSKREIPHFYLSETVDLGAASAWLERENAGRGAEDRLLMGALLLKAAALALREVPELNALWKGDRAEPQAAVHVGVAIFLPGGGLVAPALRDADKRPLDDLMKGLRDLVNRARAGTLRSSETADPTVTVTSLGERGSESLLGVIVPPQVAIVGFGRVVERPWILEGKVVPRPVAAVTLSADHRAVDGRRASAFLRAVGRLLQRPEAL